MPKTIIIRRCRRSKLQHFRRLRQSNGALSFRALAFSLFSARVSSLVPRVIIFNVATDFALNSINSVQLNRFSFFDRVNRTHRIDVSAQYFPFAAEKFNFIRFNEKQINAQIDAMPRDSGEAAARNARKCVFQQILALSSPLSDANSVNSRAVCDAVHRIMHWSHRYVKLNAMRKLFSFI